jgi:hypothetical protein
VYRTVWQIADLVLINHAKKLPPPDLILILIIVLQLRVGSHLIGVTSVDPAACPSGVEGDVNWPHP